MRDRIRWQASGAALTDEQLVTLVQHVEHWREKLQGYDLLVPRQRATGPQFYGELLILERIAVRGALADNIVSLLDALSELERLVPSVTMTVMANDVVFTATPMGFERRARMPDDDVSVRPENWVPVAEASPLVVPLFSLAEEARRHAVPFIPPEPPSLPFGFRDLDADDDATARRRAEVITMQAATASALLIVAALRDRPRSGDLFDDTMTMLGFMGTTRTAPTLVLLLEGARPEGARTREWCDEVLRTVERDDRTRDDVPSVREVLGEGTTSSVLTLSAERRAQLLAYEADDLEAARREVAAAQQWFAANRERLEELKARPQL